MKIVNFFAGPGAGKSTLAAGLFYNLKMKGINVELATEFAKDLTWEGRNVALGNQPYIFGKQYHKLHRLVGKVDVVITDSPLLLSLLYGETMPESFKTFVIDINSQFDNIDLFVNRIKIYNPSGRNQTFDEAVAIDNKIRDLVWSTSKFPYSIVGDSSGLVNVQMIVEKNL